MTGAAGAAGERRPLVIGIGNRLRGDDGIGPMVIDLLLARHDADVDTVMVAGDLSDLAMCWDTDRAVVIVDAMVSGRAPGTVTVLDGTPFCGADEPDGTAGSATGLDQPLSSHGVGLAEAIALARAIGRLPGSLSIIGIEGRSFEPGDPVSEPVAAAAPVAAEHIVESIRPRGSAVDRS